MVSQMTTDWQKCTKTTHVVADDKTEDASAKAALAVVKVAARDKDDGHVT